MITEQPNERLSRLIGEIVRSHVLAENALGQLYSEMIGFSPALFIAGRNFEADRMACVRMMDGGSDLRMFSGSAALVIQNALTEAKRLNDLRNSVVHGHAAYVDKQQKVQFLLKKWKLDGLPAAPNSLVDGIEMSFDELGQLQTALSRLATQLLCASNVARIERGGVFDGDEHADWLNRISDPDSLDLHFVASQSRIVGELRWQSEEPP